MRRLAVALALVVAAAAGAGAQHALADGDPGSDVLVNQPLFFAGDAGISIPRQETVGRLLEAASHSHFPIRVAIIATPQDLGAITGLWRRPRAYARFLGLELSQTYAGRLLVVMPNGFGFNWPGHSSAAAYRTLGGVRIVHGGGALATAAQTAVKALASAAGIELKPGRASAPQTSSSSAPSTPPPSPGTGVDALVAIIAVALLATVAIGWLARRRLADWAHEGRRLLDRRPAVVLGAAVALLAAGAAAALVVLRSPGTAQSDALATNPNLDPGTPLSGPAPAFTLTDEFGRAVSLHSFRGKVVLLAFNDSECTTICPLTTTAMLDAKAMLGRAGADVQLLGIDANPKATSLEDVFTYSQLHGMLGAWHFLTGTLPALERVWAAYKVQAAVQAGQIAHTPALFVIDPQGRERKLYVTQQSYSAVGQLGQLLAGEASRLLPGHPVVNSHLAYSQIGGISPTRQVTLPRSGGGGVRFGPGRPRLYVFFATWDRQITGLAAGLERLGRYGRVARRLGLPALEAVDEESVEPRGALNAFVSRLRPPLSYPVAVDRTGRLADGYEVQGLPWLMVVSAKGQIAWYDSVAALGWPSTSYLISRVRDALAYAAGPPATLRAALARLGGSPAPLAAVHRQASRLLEGEPALAARIRALRGYPIVVNAWASWCTPCRSEFGLFQSASARYGREVAFLGVDGGDSGGDANAFLHQHPVSYPSYQMAIPDLTGIVPQGVEGLPTTIFIDSAGKLVYVHAGQYVSQGTLDADIQTYAFRG